jgi:hypothetical protein
MRKFAFVVAAVIPLMLVGFADWNAQATTLIVPAQPNYSLAQKAGCWLPGLPGECEIGQQTLRPLPQHTLQVRAVCWLVSLAAIQDRALKHSVPVVSWRLAVAGAPSSGETDEGQKSEQAGPKSRNSLRCTG